MEELRKGPFPEVRHGSDDNAAGPVKKGSSLRTAALLCRLLALGMLFLFASIADGRSINSLLSQAGDEAAAREDERDGFNAATHKGVLQFQDVAGKGAASTSSSSSSLESYPYLALEELPTNTRRSLGGPGSSPPQCIRKCEKCVPCKPVHVPIQPGLVKTAEYYPEAWRCKCGTKLFMP